MRREILSITAVRWPVAEVHKVRLKDNASKLCIKEAKSIRAIFHQFTVAKEALGIDLSPLTPVLTSQVDASRIVIHEHMSSHSTIRLRADGFISMAI
jgi:hypothetical protein